MNWFCVVDVAPSGCVFLTSFGEVTLMVDAGACVREVCDRGV